MTIYLKVFPFSWDDTCSGIDEQMGEILLFRYNEQELYVRFNGWLNNKSTVDTPRLNLNTLDIDNGPVQVGMEVN